MLNKKDFYLYDGFYFVDEVFYHAGIIRNSGFELMILLQNYKEVYKLENDILLKQDKKKVSDLVGSSDSSNREFCYIVKGNKLILIPIEIYYGIAKSEQLLAYYTNRDIRDVMFNQVMSYNINAIISDMCRSKDKIDEYTKHQKLIKSYKKLNNMNK